jgi:hypothetical protein
VTAALCDKRAAGARCGGGAVRLQPATAHAERMRLLMRETRFAVQEVPKRGKKGRR